MSWEAFRLTSKSPAELYFILGPHGVDKKVGEMMRTCWREYAGPDRTLAAVRKVAQTVFDRNVSHWRSIRKPTPAAFFENLLPHAADGHIRQAFVLCWMMMPRGRKSIPVVAEVVTRIFERHLTAWQEDHHTLTQGVNVKSRKPAKKEKKHPSNSPRRPSRPSQSAAAGGIHRPAKKTPNQSTKRPTARRPKPRR